MDTKMGVIDRRGSCQQPLASGAKKAEGKREIPPCTPYREKGRAKKNVGVFSGNRRSCAGARVRAALDAEVSRALRALGGTERDRAMWSAVAWRVGVEAFHFALADKLAEDAVDNAARRPAAAFQAFLNARFPKTDTGRKETPTACKRASATATACLRTESRGGLPSVARSAKEGGAA